MAKKHYPSKVEKLGLEKIVQDLRVDKDTGALLSPQKIAELLHKETGQALDSATIRKYLKHVDEKKRPILEAVAKEEIRPHVVDSVDVLERIIRDGQDFMDELLPGDEMAARKNARSWASVASRVIEATKTRWGLLGGVLKSLPEMTEEELLAEHERIIGEEIEARRGASGNGATGNALPTGVPN